MVFPVNVPNVPGVPPVTRAIGALANVATFLTGDAQGLFSGLFGTPQWGIYQGGSPVVLAENVVSFDYKHQWSVADFPIERGAFASYNKVQVPYDARFRFSTGGSSAARQAFLNSIAAIAGDLNLYNIVTPDAVYINANINHYDYDRKAMSGVGLLTVDVWTTEIRQVGETITSNVASPSIAPQINGGPVQPTAATATQGAAFPIGPQ